MINSLSKVGESSRTRDMAILKLDRLYFRLYILYDQFELTEESSFLMGFEFEGKFYRSKSLVYGWRGAAKVAQSFTSQLALYLRKRGHAIFTYLDDYTGFARTKSDADITRSELLKLGTTLGLIFNAKKCSPVSEFVTPLGASIDLANKTINMDEKLKQTKLTVHTLFEKSTWNIKEIEKLVGKIEFLTLVVPHGRQYTIFLTTLLGFCQKRKLNYIDWDKPFSYVFENDDEIIKSDDWRQEITSEMDFWLDIRSTGRLLKFEYSIVSRGMSRI